MSSIIECPLRSSSGVPLDRPYLDVRYINPHTKQHLKTSALIDTGADFCIIPASFAQILGHNLELGHPSTAVGICGTEVNMFKHTMMIQIPNLAINNEPFVTKEIQISFSETVKKPILGVKTFLSNFVLTIDYPAKSFSLRLPTQDESRLNWGWSTP